MSWCWTIPLMFIYCQSPTGWKGGCWMRHCTDWMKCQMGLSLANRTYGPLHHCTQPVPWSLCGIPNTVFGNRPIIGPLSWKMSPTRMLMTVKEAVSGSYLKEGGEDQKWSWHHCSWAFSLECSLAPWEQQRRWLVKRKVVQHQDSWPEFHAHEGVPSLPHCTGNPHRGTSGQMQSTKQAVKHIHSLRPMGAHLVHEQERAPQWTLEAESHLTQDPPLCKEWSPSQQFMMRSDRIWEAVIGVRAINIRDQSGPGATFCQFVTTEEQGKGRRSPGLSTSKHPQGAHLW